MMKIKQLLFILLGNCLLYAGCGNPAEKTPSEGKKSTPKAYEAACSKCHGNDGKLMLAGAKDLSKSMISKDEIINIIKIGKGGMPAYGNLLSEAEIAEISDFVLHLRQ